MLKLFLGMLFDMVAIFGIRPESRARTGIHFRESSAMNLPFQPKKPRAACRFPYRLAKALAALIGSALLLAPAQADPRGGQSRGQGWERPRDGMGGPRERREAIDERRERWQQASPDDRQDAQGRRMRQMSPEERQRLRRDILEANRGLGNGRRH